MRCESCGGDNPKAAVVCEYCSNPLADRQRLDVAWTGKTSGGLIGLGRVEVEAPLALDGETVRALAESAFIVAADQVGQDASTGRLEDAMQERLPALLQNDVHLVNVKIEVFRAQKDPGETFTLPPPERVQLQAPAPRTPPARRAPAPSRPVASGPGLIDRAKSALLRALWRVFKPVFLLAVLFGVGYLGYQQIVPERHYELEVPEHLSSDDQDAFLQAYAEGMRAQEREAWEEADQAFTRAVDLAPKHALLRERRAGVRVERGDYQGAHEDLGVALGVEDKPDLRAARARVRLTLEDYAGARKDCDRAQELGADDGERVDYLRGQALLGLRDYKGAATSFERLLEKNPEDHAARYKRGLSRHHLGKHAGAMADYEAVLEKLPKHHAARKNLALAREAKPPEE